MNDMAENNEKSVTELFEEYLKTLGIPKEQIEKILDITKGIALAERKKALEEVRQKIVDSDLSFMAGLCPETRKLL